MDQDAIHKAATVGELRRQGYLSRSVKQEMRANLIARLKDDPLNAEWHLLER